MKKTFKSFLNEKYESELDKWYHDDDKIWDDFLQELYYTAFHSKYQLVTELGFNPKIVIETKTGGFWFYIYRSIEDNPLFSLQFSITNVKEFINDQIKTISKLKGKDITIEEFLPKFIAIRK